MDEKALTLIIGGARSGKSALAERLAAESGAPVIYVATLEAGDSEMDRRIAGHRARRPAGWQTIEAPLDPTGALRMAARPGALVLLDCLSVWVSNLVLSTCGEAETITGEMEAAARSGVLSAVDGLLAWYASGTASLIVVTNEVGSGLVPPYPLGRLYRDILGVVNQRVAAVADRVYSVTAGLALELKGLGARPVAGAPTAARGKVRRTHDSLR
jgi:adenosylcobinamide kinase/adenosylcobinamide-phosphate guanylyltransferase